jgi:hypothetical protein
LKCINFNSERNYHKELKQITYFLYQIFGRFLSDRLYSNLVFFYNCIRMRRPWYYLNIVDPKSFNEKINWIKFKVRNPLSTEVADKLAVRDYVRDKIGDDYLVHLYSVHKGVEEIEFDKLPRQHVIKFNSGSGVNFICSDSGNIKTSQVKSFFNKALKVDLYHYSREWHYRLIEPKILIERFLGENIKDYKIHCSGNSGPFCIQVDSDRFNSHKRNLYDLKWRLLDLEYVYPKALDKDEEPVNLQLMINLAIKLSRDFIYSRIDFYEVEGKVYFGEITLHPEGGFGPFRSYSEDLFFGDFVDLK